MRIILLLCTIMAFCPSHSDSFCVSPSTASPNGIRKLSIKPSLLHMTDPDRFTFNKYQDDEDGILGYLPWFKHQRMNAKEKELLTQATRRHIYGDTRNDPHLKATDVLALIASQYKCTDVPVKLGEKNIRAGVDAEYGKVSRILSFAAYHRLPKEIAECLFGEDKSLLKYREDFIKLRDWSSVSFPRGLAIRPPRKLLDSPVHRFNPIPRQWRRTQNIRIAEGAVNEASQIKAPPRRLQSNEEFMDSISRALRSKPKRFMIQELLPFFPTKRNIFHNVITSISTLKTSLKFILKILRISKAFVMKSLPACVLSTSMLAFLSYTSSMIWQWRQLSVTFCAGSSAIGSSLMRVSAVLARAYTVGWKDTLLISALGFAPIAHRGLKNLSYRLREKSDTRALIRITSLLTFSHIGIAALIFLLDAAMLNSVYYREMLMVMS